MGSLMKGATMYAEVTGWVTIPALAIFGLGIWKAVELIAGWL